MSRIDMSKCPICTHDLAQEIRSDDLLERILSVNCKRCGRYSITSEAVMGLGGLGIDDKARLSCILRERQIHRLSPLMLFSETPTVSTSSDAGYEPFRVDLKEFIGDIMDEVMAGIRNSRFVVADVTEQKNGVYYEAGFAQGLGIPVIWTCRKDEMASVHFDTQQYNHIVWENAKALRSKLFNRIRAVIT